MIHFGWIMQALLHEGIFFVNTSQKQKHFLRSAFVFGDDGFATWNIEPCSAVQIWKLSEND